jgi:thiamine-phosphate pyrophosphorylase
MVSRGEAHTSGAGHDLVQQARAAAQAGAHLIHIRERHLEGRAMVGLVRACVAAVAGTRARVVVNDRLDVALAGGAHGVHLREASAAARTVRTACPAGFLVGRSIHAPAQAAVQSEAGGLDYLVFGTVFPTPSKPGETGAGLEALRLAVRAASVPVLAIGGVDGDTVGEIARAGAAGFAAIRFWTMPEHQLGRAVAAVTAVFSHSRR